MSCHLLAHLRTSSFAPFRKKPTRDPALISALPCGMDLSFEHPLPSPLLNHVNFSRIDCSAYSQLNVSIARCTYVRTYASTYVPAQVPTLLLAGLTCFAYVKRLTMRRQDVGMLSVCLSVCLSNVRTMAKAEDTSISGLKSHS